MRVALAGAGARIAVHGLAEEAQAKAVCAALVDAGAPEARFFPGDLQDPDEIADLMTAVSGWGGADILVNNAGIQHGASIPEFPMEKWDAIIAINMSSAFHTTAMALPMMRAAGWGRVINVASAHGLRASPFKSAYVTAKHGVVGLTKVTALETAREQITCNAICPGYVLTPLVEAQIPATAKEYGISESEAIEKVILLKQPSKEFVTVEQLAGMALFLCSGAAAQVTGTQLTADGGWTSQ